MAIQADGADLQFSEIQTEFGGSNPIGISEYYSGGSNVGANTGNIPASGEIQLSDFYGAANYVAISATGGSVTTSGDYKFHTFTSSGTWEVTEASGSASNTVDYFEFDEKNTLTNFLN